MLRFSSWRERIADRDYERHEPKPKSIATGDATCFIPRPGDKGKPITVGPNSIRAGFGVTCLQPALNARSAPGVTDLVLNPTHTWAAARR